MPCPNNQRGLRSQKRSTKLHAIFLSVEVLIIEKVADAGIKVFERDLALLITLQGESS